MLDIGELDVVVVAVVLVGLAQHDSDGWPQQLDVSGQYIAIHFVFPFMHPEHCAHLISALINYFYELKQNLFLI